MDKYLKFESEEAAKSVLYTEVPTAWDNTDPENPVPTEFYSQPNYINIDTIGVIYNDDAVFGEDDEVITEATAKDGWHVNVRLMDGEDGDALQGYAVEPTNPRRVWA